MTIDRLLNMTNYQEPGEFEFFRPLYQLAVIMAVATPYGIGISVNTVRHHRRYALFVTILLITFYILSTVGRIFDSYPGFPTVTVVITDALLSLFLIIQNSVSVLAPSYWFCNELSTFLTTFLQLHKGFSMHEIVVVKGRKKFIKELIFGHVLLFLLFIFNSYLWYAKFGEFHFRSYIFENVQNYYSFIVIMLMYNFTIILNNIFLSLNNMLETNTFSSFSLERIKSVESGRVKISNTNLQNQVRHLSQLYGTLTEQVSLFNKIFGWQILFCTGTTIIGILNTIDWLISYGIFNDGGIDFEIGLTLLSTFWSMLQFILSIIVAVSCNAVTKEAERTGDICYNLLLNLPSIPDKLQEQILREDLLLLSDISTKRSPYFSAAGFFNVDYTTLLAILGSVTSYVIVLIQFN